MDRLALFKVLADSSRYAIYLEIARADGALSTGEVAERLQLHPNTVRLHLEKLRDAGLVETFPDRHGSVGRPQHRWSVVSDAPSLGLEPAGFRVLAHLLAEVAAQTGSEPQQVAVAGRRRGAERVSARPIPLGAEGKVPLGAGQPRPERLRLACVRAVLDELSDLGFDPTVSTEDGRDTISFAKCPFRELAVLYPDLVCELHRGITEGILSGVATANPGVDAGLESFSSLVDRDPCRAQVFISA